MTLWTAVGLLLFRMIVLMQDTLAGGGSCLYSVQTIEVPSSDWNTNIGLWAVAWWSGVRSRHNVEDLGESQSLTWHLKSDDDKGINGQPEWLLFFKLKSLGTIMEPSCRDCNCHKLLFELKKEETCGNGGTCWKWLTTYPNKWVILGK